MRTSEFVYNLPEAAIAQAAIEPRDTARLLVAPVMRDSTFRDLPKLLRPGDLLVVNRTKVRASRLTGTRRGTGGSCEVLLTKHLAGDRWQALVRPARRLRKGTVIDMESLTAELLTDPTDGIVELQLCTHDDSAVETAIANSGQIPLPPYFHGTLTSLDRYQTLFAASVGSSAAPTAGLHFTRRVVEALDARGVAITAVDLEVGLDTFRPIATADIADHVMHRERYHVPTDTVSAVKAARLRGGRIIAVGTTVVRTLESATRDRQLRGGAGETGLFIKPGYEFTAIDGLVTNFHAPGTSLIVLLAAFYPGWRAAYRHALDSGYRFLSFGDAMLVLP